MERIRQIPTDFLLKNQCRQKKSVGICPIRSIRSPINYVQRLKPSKNEVMPFQLPKIARLQ